MLEGTLFEQLNSNLLIAIEYANIFGQPHNRGELLTSFIADDTSVVVRCLVAAEAATGCLA